MAFEPDPTVFEVLCANVTAARLRDVTLINKALSDHEGPLTFLVEGADAGRMLREQDQPAGHTCTVPAVRLREYLSGPVDLLKLDIEGAETAVLMDCADLLGNVGALFVEYHSFAGEEQRLPALLALLQQAGFRLYVQTVRCPPRPLIERPAYLGMDLQLNIFGARA